jgi:hypothetical protein
VQRFIAILLCTCATASALSQSVVGAEKPPQPLLELTDVVWVSNLKRFTSSLGEYKRCGNYVFTYTPHAKPGAKPVTMIGVGYPQVAPVTDKVSLGETALKKSDQVRFIELRKGGTSASQDVSAVDAEHPFAILLSKPEIEKVRMCLRMKSDQKKTT